MIKVINRVSHNNSLRKEMFNQFTKCGDVYANDESTDAFLLCSFCTRAEERILRTIEEFIEHIKWHRSEYEPSSAFETVVIGNGKEMQLLPEGDPIDVKPDLKPESTEHEYVDDILSQISYDCLVNVIDLFKKCPCLWHSVTAEDQKQFIDSAKCMITNYFNKLTKSTESVEYVEELLEKIKHQFLEEYTDENYTSNPHFEILNFLSTSEMASLDQSIYTDFRCTICKQKLESWKVLWNHLCECHMEIEDHDLSSIDFNDDGGSEYEEKYSVTENKPKKYNAEYITEFIEAYKNQPRLWNKKHPQYTNRRLREKSYKVLMAIMKKYNNVATKRAVLGKIRCFRTQFIYAKRKMLESKERDCIYIPHIWYYDKLLFLEGKIREKRNIENCPQPDPQNASVNNSIAMSSTCTVCNMEFPNSMECLDHVQNFHDSSEFQSDDGFFYCPICSIQSKTNCSFVRHLRHKHSSNFKVCDDCGTKYRFMSELVKHKAKEHKDFLPYKCPDCGKGFADLSNMKMHSVTHRDVEDRPHVCGVCGSRFSNKGNLVVHVRRHTRDFKIRCEICDHKVATTTELRSHMLTHTKDYPCVCDICGKKFRNSRRLKLHQEEFHGDDTYPCDICDEKFKSNRKLLLHLETHKTIADQECKICGRKFMRTRSLQNHLRRKHKTTIRKIEMENKKKTFM